MPCGWPTPIRSTRFPHLSRPHGRRGARGFRAHDAPLRQAGIRFARDGHRWHVRRRRREDCLARSRSATSSISNATLPKGQAQPIPKLLIVAPMSGHYATLLRGTVEALLPQSDVYITDWIDARMVPLTEGTFDLERLYRLRHRDAAFPWTRHACRRRLPAGRSGACRRGA